jgi:hypothetical protein
MGRIESGAVERLHYALTDSQCNNCGAQLQWNPVFDNVNLPKYTASHCGQVYTINVETVKFDVVPETKTEKERKIQEEKKALDNKEPRAILMAEGKKKETPEAEVASDTELIQSEKKSEREPS